MDLGPDPGSEYSRAGHLGPSCSSCCHFSEPGIEGQRFGVHDVEGAGYGKVFGSFCFASGKKQEGPGLGPFQFVKEPS